MPRMKYVYQLMACGPTVAFSGNHIVYSDTVFSAEELARQRIDKFRALVTDPRRLDCFTGDVSIRVKRLEIVE